MSRTTACRGSGRRFRIESLEGRLALSAAGAVTLPLFNLTEATTKDAASVTVDYSIAKADIQQPLTFDVYRSDKPALDSASALLGEATLDPTVDAAKLTQGTHAGVTLLGGTVLTPNTSLPYLVVVADGNGAVAEDSSSVNSTYFRTYLLGVVVHGLEFSSSDATPAWETSMATDLTTIDHYDSVIAFNWVKDSSIPAPGMATKAGDALYSQLTTSAAALNQNHAGDVVDLHFIGHSRGAVVVSRTLQDLVSQPVAALTGSYVKVTLLDPHPSNVADTGLYSVQQGRLGSLAAIAYLAFESSTKDPEVVLPAAAGIRTIEVYYQHTPASGFPIKNVESLLNLWGEGQSDGLLINRTSVSIQWHNLTSVKDPNVGLIGHSETHAWYQLYVVDTGSTIANVSAAARPSALGMAGPVSELAAPPSGAAQIDWLSTHSNRRPGTRWSRSVNDLSHRSSDGNSL
jgi:hypothetical protein